jgi:mannose-6-phosphate isomerase-like protein (cupin superfamily)
MSSSSTLEPIDTEVIKAAHPEAWHAEVLAAHAGVHLKYRVMRGTVADFHTHDVPECFFVLSGRMNIDTEGGTVALGPGQFFAVQPGVLHRSRVQGEVTALVFDAIPA